jgi:hypothetical protein
VPPLTLKNFPEANCDPENCSGSRLRHIHLRRFFLRARKGGRALVKIQRQKRKPEQNHDAAFGKINRISFHEASKITIFILLFNKAA